MVGAGAGWYRLMHWGESREVYMGGGAGAAG